MGQVTDRSHPISRIDDEQLEDESGRFQPIENGGIFPSGQ